MCNGIRTLSERHHVRVKMLDKYDALRRFEGRMHKRMGQAIFCGLRSSRSKMIYILLTVHHLSNDFRVF